MKKFLSRLKSSWGQQVDWLLLVIIPLLAVQPLLRGRLPWSADGLLHYHRLAQFHRCMRHGILYPRWAPDLGFGYGFPLFNYYAPLSYYLAEPLRLIGLNTQQALLGAFILAAFVAGLGAYLTAHDLFGQPMGLIAAAAYVYAPYFLYNLIHRGALAETWGMALLPFPFWSLRNLIRYRRRKDFLLTSLFYAALLLTHNITALVATPLLILYASFLWFIYHNKSIPSTTSPSLPASPLLLGGALLLGLGLAAFFWAPAFFEKEYVQIHQLYAPANLDYRNNFVSLSQVLAAPRSVDPRLISPDTPRSLGWPQLILALLAGLGSSISTAVISLVWYLQRNEQERPSVLTSVDEAHYHVFLLWAGVLALTAMMLPLSIGIWDRVPMLRFVQFPWRFLGPTSLFLAIVAGVGVVYLSISERFRWSIVALALAAMMGFSLTWLFPSYYPSQSEPTPSQTIAFERETGALGTTSAGDYLPIWVKTLPPSDSLLPLYESSGGGAIPRLDASALPSTANVLAADYTLTSADLRLQSDADLTAVFNWYFFPGWQATIDGRPVDLRPVGEHGLIGVDVPAGERHVTVRFGNTPLRRWAAGISLASVVILILYLVLAPLMTTRRFVADVQKKPAIENVQYPAITWFSTLLVIVSLFAVKHVYLDHYPSPLRRTRFDGQSVAGVQTPLQVDFGGEMMLMGYDLDSPTVRADGLLDVTLYWRAQAPLDTDYSIALHIVDEQGRLYGQEDSQHPAGYPTSRWDLNSYARDLHRLAPWPGAPPGAYTLQVAVYDVDTGRRLEVRDATGAPVGASQPITVVQITRPSHPFNPAEIDIAQRWDTGDDDAPALTRENPSGVRLLGFDPPPAQVYAGGRLPFTLYWQAQSADDPLDDYTAVISLAALDGARDVVTREVARELAPPGRASYPTSAWRAGDVVRHGHALLVPADTPAGVYGLYVDLQDASGRLVNQSAAETPVPLTRVDVRAPERRFDPPAIQHPISPTVDFEDDAAPVAALIGYDLDEAAISPGQPFTVTLHWQARGTADTGYVVFVHLVREGNIIAQSDRVPASGTRPTTGWLPGEFIADSHVLVIPPETPEGEEQEYTLALGLYDPATDQRLTAFDDERAILGDHLALPTTIRIGE